MPAVHLYRAYLAHFRFAIETSSLQPVEKAFSGRVLQTRRRRARSRR